MLKYNQEKSGKGFQLMKKCGINQLITLLLGSIAFNNVIFQRYPNPKKIATSH